jgi:hypothetical protein
MEADFIDYHFQDNKGDNTVSFEIMELEKSSGLLKMQQQI